MKTTLATFPAGPVEEVASEFSFGEQNVVLGHVVIGVDLWAIVKNAGTGDLDFYKNDVVDFSIADPTGVVYGEKLYVVSFGSRIWFTVKGSSDFFTVDTIAQSHDGDITLSVDYDVSPYTSSLFSTDTAVYIVAKHGPSTELRVLRVVFDGVFSVENTLTASGEMSDPCTWVVDTYTSTGLDTLVWVRNPSVPEGDCPGDFEVLVVGIGNSTSDWQDLVTCPYGWAPDADGVTSVHFIDGFPYFMHRTGALEYKLYLCSIHAETLFEVFTFSGVHTKPTFVPFTLVNRAFFWQTPVRASEVP